MQLNAKFLTRLKAEAPGVGMPNQHIAIAMHARAEFSLAALAKTTGTSLARHQARW